MISVKDSVKKKKGSYTVEAALTLPVFILVFVALALVINFIAECENAVFEECRTLYRLDRTAPLVLTVPTNKAYRVRDFDYLYSDGGSPFKGLYRFCQEIGYSECGRISGWIGVK